MVFRGVISNKQTRWAINEKSRFAVSGRRDVENKIHVERTKLVDEGES